jgi:hypothetical protein
MATQTLTINAADDANTISPVFWAFLLADDVSDVISTGTNSAIYADMNVAFGTDGITTTNKAFTVTNLPDGTITNLAVRLAVPLSDNSGGLSDLEVRTAIYYTDNTFSSSQLVYTIPAGTQDTSIAVISNFVPNSSKTLKGFSVILTSSDATAGPMSAFINAAQIVATYTPVQEEEEEEVQTLPYTVINTNRTIDSVPYSISKLSNGVGSHNSKTIDQSAKSIRSTAVSGYTDEFSPLYGTTSNITLNSDTAVNNLHIQYATSKAIRNKSL